ncbi:hypothetical protein BBC27_08020 [Acidithiobacillus ferrivorans]|uniref:Uncharacterized protein n=1 Tax=Acidithiobacillus ferrivorans TaxID=160808 RepID=A0A1B9C0H2_9PROT|nr:hypothetical protein [Acidithiobacillus ferrivorans]OCB03403.1 hypothetical protein BBC27_08020 [Acidithiobacillus ferrivorans]
MGIVRQMIQQDTPPPAVEKALAGLDEAILGQIPPVWIEPMANWSGYCAYEFVAEGEIRISDVACGVRLDTDSPALARVTRDIILHEYAHRLLGPGYGHNGAFAAMRLTLSFRATNLPDQDEHPDWRRVKLYDIHDHHQDSLITMPQALAWAWSTAQELSKTASTAEQCAATIKARWTKFTDAQEHRAERLERQKAQQKRAAIDAEQMAEAKKRTHRLDKLYLFGFGLIGYAAAILVAVHH